MDFFTHQEQARRKTGTLVLYFGLAVIIIILAVYLVTMIIFSQVGTESGAPPRMWDPRIFLTITTFTILLVTCGSLYKISALRGGGAQVAQSLGGRLIQPNTKNFQEKRLLNVVEEMAIASGIAMPPVYLMENEMGINAFAAGFGPENAVIGVTKGTLQILNRDELQGVMAHEFSHILNGDMRINIRLIGVLHGILLIGIIGFTIIRSVGYGTRFRRRSKEGSGGTLAILAFGLAIMVIGYVGVFFGKLIKSAVSRQREYLADASAVQFTRNPLGIAGALKKIGGLADGSRIQNAKAEEASHLFFGNGLSASWISMLATHPPLVKRVQRIDSQFDGKFPVVELPKPDEKEERAEKKGTAGQPMPFPIPVPLPSVPDIAKPAILASMAADPDTMVESIGAPMAEHFEAARALIGAIPETVREAASEPFGARAIVYSLLLDNDAEIRNSQIDQLEHHADPAVLRETSNLLGSIHALPRETRLPLADLAIAGLRALSREQYLQFKKNIKHLVEADQSIDMFEYALQHMLIRHLDVAFGLITRSKGNIRSLKPVALEASCIFSLLARIGHDEKNEIENAFKSAVHEISQSGAAMRLLSPDECTLDHVDQALKRLNDAAPLVKKQVVDACFKSLVHDGKITMGEAELFRAIAFSLNCPVPPWLTAVEG